MTLKEAKEINELADIWFILNKTTIPDYQAQKIQNYIDNLQQELANYKEELAKADSMLQSEIFEGKELSSRELLNMLKDYKERNEKAIKFIEDDYYSMNTRNLDSIPYTTNKFLKLREILKEEQEILDKKDNVVTISTDMTHFFDGVAELDTTPLLSSEEILKMIREEERNRKNVDNTHI